MLCCDARQSGRAHVDGDPVEGKGAEESATNPEKAGTEDACIERRRTQGAGGPATNQETGCTKAAHVEGDGTQGAGGRATNQEMGGTAASHVDRDGTQGAERGPSSSSSHDNRGGGPRRYNTRMCWQRQ